MIKKSHAEKIQRLEPSNKGFGILEQFEKLGQI